MTATLRQFILYDANGLELELTPQSNVPVELVDSNGLNLDLTAQGNVPVAVKDAAGLELALTQQSNVPSEIVDSNGLNLDLTAQSNAPVALRDANGLEYELTPQKDAPVALRDANGRDLELTTEDNVPVALKDKNGLELEMFADGSVPVRSVPQSTPTVILPFVQHLGATTLAAQAVVDAYDVIVTSVVGMVIGQHFRVIDDTADKFYFGEIVNIVGATITLDTQIDFAYEAGAEVTFSNKNLSVDGSITPVIFKARTGNLSIPAVVNITRILFTCIADTAVSLVLFGDLPKLARGLALRIVRPTLKRNILNVKNNEEIVNLAFDFTVFEAINPAQGVDGFSARLTFGGENKLGTVLQLAQDDNLELLVQDDLTGLIRLIVTLEGNIVQE